jgi:hypothetical protein
MATVLNTGLHRKIGMEFEYKISFQEFLTEAIASPLVVPYNTGANTPAAREAAKNKFVICGPSMGFEAKKFAYATLELVVGALVANANVPAADKTALNDQLVNITRYVGLTGDGDFHFMVATFNLAETISYITADVVPAPQAPTGTIVTLTLLDGGSGYTDTVDGTPDGVITIAFESTESTNPAGYTEGAGTVSISGGEVISIDSIDDGGAGFKVGQIVTITHAGADNGDTPAFAEVTAVS